jgi:RNA recognition motif-containing protein
MGATLYVGNLPFSATEEEIRNLFQSDGRSVVDVRLIHDRETGRPRGFGFVELASEDEAKAALESLADTDMGGRKLTITIARDR